MENIITDYTWPINCIYCDSDQVTVLTHKKNCLCMDCGRLQINVYDWLEPKEEPIREEQ